MFTLSRRTLAFCSAAAVAALYLIWDAHRPARYWSGGVCLSFDPNAVETIGTETLSPLSQPYFYIPYHPVPGAVDAKETRITASFEVSEISRKIFIEKSTTIHLEECDRRENQFGLFVTVDSEAKKNCTSADNATIYDPIEKDNKYGAVRIRCSDNPTVPNCEMTDIYPNGGAATISFPKTFITEWKEISDAVESYFMANLAKCGERE